MPYLSAIHLFPFKSLDGITVEQATILPSGALLGDRAFALVDEQGCFVNGKRNALVHCLRAHFDLHERILALRIQGTSDEHFFQVDTEREQLNAWFSTYFGFPVKMQENTAQGFPDDTLAPGPTLLSTETVATVMSWFPGVDQQTFPLRFRANLEIAGAPPFWEDRLYGEDGEGVRFKIGSVLFEGVNPCKRCVVPSRDPISGEAYPLFQKTFMQKRRESLPAWATRSRFNHFYRLSINTCVPPSEAGKTLHVGDQVCLEAS
ncbi:MAG TPA: MOSC N-terminal beta barrel domain-containing protein [Ktedonosporobacter sp.]|nr:MOSC N-terminal beta barrel domain-containing protein [Ktedonosporobacter sp.]